jgi:hypothetical protein
MMKRLFLIGIIGLFFSGCGASAKESEFWKHPSLYKDWDHMKYSQGQDRSPQMTKESKEDGWWGITQYESPK